MRKSSKLTNIFQLGWNHQLVLFVVQVIFLLSLNHLVCCGNQKWDLSPFWENKNKHVFLPANETNKQIEANFSGFHKQDAVFRVAYCHKSLPWGLISTLHVIYPTLRGKLTWLSRKIPIFKKEIYIFKLSTFPASYVSLPECHIGWISHMLRARHAKTCLRWE